MERERKKSLEFAVFRQQIPSHRMYCLPKRGTSKAKIVKLEISVF